jgi:hypothetical protein
MLWSAALAGKMLSLMAHGFIGGQFGRRIKEDK